MIPNQNGKTGITNSLWQLTANRQPLVTPNNFPVCHSALGNECGGVARGYGNCWRLWQIAGNASIMKEDALSILIYIFPHNSNKPRPQTESYIFSDLGSLPNMICETAHWLLGIAQSNVCSATLVGLFIMWGSYTS